MNHQETWRKALAESESLLNRFWNDPAQIEKCAQFSNVLIDCFNRGGTVFTCGNGGSQCDSLHFAEELTGRYRKDRRPLAALALGEASHVTCTGNDYGFNYIFSRQIEALGRPGDVLIGLSTSGNSQNIITAFEAAKAKNLKTIALLGKDGGKIKGTTDLDIVIPAPTSDRVQEMHIKLLHIVIETVERRLFPEHYV